MLPIKICVSKSIQIISKKIIRIGLTSLILVSLSCNKNNSLYGTVTQNIVQTVASNPDLSYLNVAIKRAKSSGNSLQNILGGSDNYTFFAPNNSAFMNAGFLDTASIQSTNPYLLNSIISNLVIPGSFTLADIPYGANMGYSTLNNSVVSVDSLYITTISGNVVYVDGTLIVSPDNLATNGVLQIIGSLFIPPTNTIAGFVQQRATSSISQFTLLNEVLQVTGMYSNLANRDSAYTLFAPTDSAFLAIGMNQTKIDHSSPAHLDSILNLHLVRSRVFNADLISGQLYTLNGELLTVTVSFGQNASLTGKGNRNGFAKIIPYNSPPYVGAIDILTENGVIHVINQVLLP